MILQDRNISEFECLTFNLRIATACGPGSVVGIATDYRLDGPGIDSRWGEIFRTCPDRSWGTPSLLYNGYRVFPWVKSGRCVTLTPHPLLMPWSWKGRAIPVLPLRAVLPVQSLSACTRMHFTFYHCNSVHLLDIIHIMGYQLMEGIECHKTVRKLCECSCLQNVM